MLLHIILPTILLVEPFDNLVLKYVAAINVVQWGFDFMLVINKWPGKFKQINIDFLMHFLNNIRYSQKCTYLNFFGNQMNLNKRE